MSDEPASHGELQVDEDLSWERREWVFERAGWLVMFGITVLALLGMFGSGILSDTSTSSPSGTVTVDYPRFGRDGAPIELELTASGAPNDAGLATVWIARSYLDRVVVEQITPQPASMAADMDRVYFEFEVQETSDLVVRFTFQAMRVGVQTAYIGIESGDSLNFWQFVYP